MPLMLEPSAADAAAAGLPAWAGRAFPDGLVEESRGVWSPRDYRWSLDEEARLQRLEALRGELASLQGALSSANLNLAKAIREAGLSDEQSLEVGKLLSA